MKVNRKMITITVVVFTALLALALVGIWRIGLLPLLLYHSNSGESNLLWNTETTTDKTAPGIPGETATLGKTPGALSAAPGNIPDTETLNNTGKSPLQLEIEAKHIARLRAIAGSYEGRLNSLIARAWSEYNSSAGKGSKVSALALARKYISQGEALEAECDSKFYAALADFEADLRRHNLPTTTAEIARKEYERAKAARKKELLSQAFRRL